MYQHGIQARDPRETRFDLKVVTLRSAAWRQRAKFGAIGLPEFNYAIAPIAKP